MTFESYIELCKARRKDFEGLEDEDQPMIEATAVGELFNRLNPTMNASLSDRPATPQCTYSLPVLGDQTTDFIFYLDLIPELTVRFTLSSS